MAVPSDRLYHASGIVTRIVMGNGGLAQARLDMLRAEEDEHGPFLWLPLQVQAIQMHARSCPGIAVLQE